MWMDLCIWMCVHIYVPMSVCFSMGYIGVCVSLIDRRIKTTSFCGILTDHIATFCVKELGGPGSQGHEEDCVVGTLTTVRTVHSMIPGSGGPVVTSRICFRIGPAGLTWWHSG